MLNTLTHCAVLCDAVPLHRPVLAGTQGCSRGRSTVLSWNDFPDSRFHMQKSTCTMKCNDKETGSD